MLTGRSRLRAAVTLLFGRVIYAFNWYNVGAVLPLLGRGLAASTFELGVVLGAFLLGAAVFQIPAGFAALRWGSRTVSVFALFLMGSFAVASAFAPSWPVLAVLRFGTGAGAAFFFAPALGLVTSYYPAGTRGPIIGVYVSGFSIGSGVGLFGGALIGALYGWPAALLVGGVALLVMGTLAPFGLPRLESRPPARTMRAAWDAALPVLRSRSMWALALATSGIWGGFYVAAQYFIAFAEAVHPDWSVALAAAVPTVMTLIEIPAGPIGGWLGERASEMRRTLGAWCLASGAAIVLVPFLPLGGLFALFAFLGFADGVVFTVLYLLPSYLPESRGESLALGLAFMNSIQIFLGSAVAVTFGFVAGAVGYTWAWMFAAAVSLAPVPLLIHVARRRSPTGAPALGSPTTPRAVRPPVRPA